MEPHPENLKPFKKGDPRINRHGRPKSFDAWRKLNIAILQEVAKDKDGQPIIIDGHIATNAEMVARSKLKDPKHQNDVIEAAYGKVPQPIDVTTGGEKITKVIIEHVRSNSEDTTTGTPPSSGAGQTDPQEV